MGHLDEDRTQAVDVLSGAFMMVKKTILNQTGGFDEQFFMYAEDIDLSYRIDKAGFKIITCLPRQSFILKEKAHRKIFGM